MGYPLYLDLNFKKFPEAQLFIAQGIGFSIQDGKGFHSTVAHIEANREGIADQIKRFVLEQEGAAEKIIEKIV